MRTYITAFIFMTLSFLGTSVAFAQSEELADLAMPLLNAVMSGQYAVAAALALVFAVAVLKRYGVSRWPVLDSPAAGSILVLVGGFGAALATALSAGAAISLSLAYTALKVAVTAAGGYSLAKPLLRLLQDKAPAWAAIPLKLVTWIFEKRGRVEAAEAAGEAAVKANPGAGSEIAFRDFE